MNKLERAWAREMRRYAWHRWWQKRWRRKADKHLDAMRNQADKLSLIGVRIKEAAND